MLLLVKFQAKATLLYGCFSRFLNCSNKQKGQYSDNANALGAYTFSVLIKFKNKYYFCDIFSRW